MKYPKRTVFKTGKHERMAGTDWPIEVVVERGFARGWTATLVCNGIARDQSLAQSYRDACEAASEMGAVVTDCLLVFGAGITRSEPACSADAATADDFRAAGLRPRELLGDEWAVVVLDDAQTREALDYDRSVRSYRWFPGAGYVVE